jgi:hypothetical protein
MNKKKFQEIKQHLELLLTPEHFRNELPHHKKWAIDSSKVPEDTIKRSESNPNSI